MRYVPVAIVGVALSIMITAIVLTAGIAPVRVASPAVVHPVQLTKTRAQLRALRPLVAAPALSIDIIRTNPGRDDVVAAKPHPVERITANQTVTIRGWAYDPDAKAPAQTVLVDFGGSLLVPGDYGGERADVATAFGNANLAATGFSVTIPAGLLGPGAHAADVIVVAADGLGYYRAPKRVTIDESR